MRQIMKEQLRYICDSCTDTDAESNSASENSASSMVNFFTPVSKDVCSFRPLRNFSLLFLLALFFYPCALFGEYHVSPTGNNSTGNGSASRPWKTIAHALNSVPRAGGEDIWCEPGTYDALIRIERDVDFQQPVRIRAVNPYKSRLTFSRDNTVMYLKGGNYSFEGFEIFGNPVGHTGDYTPNYVFHVIFIESARHLTFENNIIHDSYAKDLMTMIKSNHIVLKGNVWYNQSREDEHVDVNIGSENIEIQDNIFFNDFEGSGRVNPRNTSAYIVIKTSNEPERVTNAVYVRRNILMNYQGYRYHFIRLGEDDRYPGAYEAEDLLFENNLFLVNGPDAIKSVFATWGVRNVTIRANTVVATTPPRDFLAYLGKGPNNNPRSRDITISNNIVADSTGTMSRLCYSPPDEFVAGTGTIHNNLYWNDGNSIPVTSGDDINYTDDTARIIKDPLLPKITDGEVPRWTGNSFRGGYNSIREAFLGLAHLYGKPSGASPVVDVADESEMPYDDITGKQRDNSPDIGAFEIGQDTTPPAAPTGLLAK
jgi:hypothetical protein